MSIPKPTATGSLDSTPVLNLLVYALDRRLTGTLVLEEQPGGHKHAVHFLMGGATKAKTARDVVYLGQVLVELGFISEEVRSRTFTEAQASGALHGQVLLAANLIDEVQLKAGLREQLIRQLSYLATRPRDTLYGYYDDVNLLERWGSEQVIRSRPLELIWRIAESYADPHHMQAVLQRLGPRPLRLHVEAPISRFHFGRSEQAVLDVMRAKPQPLEELLARELAPRQRVLQLIYVLAVTRQFELSADLAPLGFDDAPSSSRVVLPGTPNPSFSSSLPPQPFSSRPPLRTSFTPAPTISEMPEPRRTPTPTGRASSPELLSFRDEILTRAAREAETHYETLGLTNDVPHSEIQPTFLNLAKKWHPDRLPPELADLKDSAGRVFARMTEASRVLGDAIQRREYDKSLRRAGREAEEQEQVQRVLKATAAYQRAEVFLKRGNLSAAEGEARAALTDDPDQPEYIALVAWLDAQKPDANVEACIKQLDRAIQIQSNSVRARWYRGQLYKRVGKMNRAVTDFKAVVEKDPRHTDALREIRLYLMRRGDRATSVPPPSDGSRPQSPAPSGSPSPDKSKDGLIKKWFKR